MQINNYVQMMIDSLKIKEDILKKLVDLNEDQKEIILAVEFNENDFQENAEKKDKLIDNLMKLDEGFQNLFNKVKEELNKDRAAYKDEIESMQNLIRSITALSAKLEVQEAHNKESIQNRFQKMKKDIQTAKKSTRMATQYYKNMNKIDTEPQLFEKKQ